MNDCYREVVAVDFEFIATAGNRPIPVCLVAHELRSGRRFRVWQDQFGSAPPYATGQDVLFVAYYASADLGCYRVRGWPMPERILDLFTEFRARTNGLGTPAGNSLLGALSYFGLDGMGAAEKDDMRALILSGGPWSADERTAILDYCEADVGALERLVPAMLPKVDLPPGRYYEGATWPPQPQWSTLGRRSTSTCLSCSGATGQRSRIGSSPRSTQPMASLKAAPLRLNGSPGGWPETTSPGRCSKAAISI